MTFFMKLLTTGLVITKNKIFKKPEEKVRREDEEADALVEKWMKGNKVTA